MARIVVVAVYAGAVNIGTMEVMVVIGDVCVGDGGGDVGSGGCRAADDGRIN